MTARMRGGRRYLRVRGDAPLWECTTCHAVTSDLDAHDRLHDPRRVEQPADDRRQQTEGGSL